VRLRSRALAACAFPFFGRCRLSFVVKKILGEKEGEDKISGAGDG